MTSTLKPKENNCQPEPIRSLQTYTNDLKWQQPLSLKNMKGISWVQRTNDKQSKEAHIQIGPQKVRRTSSNILNWATQIVWGVMSL